MSLLIADARALAQGTGMNAEETIALLELLVASTLSVQDGADLLRTWAGRGETGPELAATVSFLRSHAIQVPLSAPSFDLCGTGGSGLTRYNVSTTVAFIAAAAGIPVAKHGNRGSHRPNGSFDLLDALGVPFDLSPDAEARLQDETGLCFLFARSHHPAVGRVVAYRKAAGCRSIFNLAGPLANPAPIKHQIIGTSSEKSALVLAEGMSLLETAGALVVWGEPGIDEISVTGRTNYFRVSPAGCVAGALDAPKHPDLDYRALPGGDSDVNALLFHRLLNGEETGPLLDMVCENAGAAIDLWNGVAPAPESPGAVVARKLIRSGNVREAFALHRDRAQLLRSQHQT
jgi:anthranilate phosphoribosyltransferase